MAIVKPFKCIRPIKEAVCDVAALPYDVYDRVEAKKAVENNRLSFLNIDRPETQFDADFDMYSDEAYNTAKRLLDERILDGTYKKDNELSYYLYELGMNGRFQTGITAVCSIDDYINNVIKKHENTREEKELDRIKHVDICNAQTGPIFLAYKKNEILANIIKREKEKECLYDFISGDGISHRVWKVTDSIEEIEKEFSKIDALYIADGHHRAASAVKVGLKRREENKEYNGNEEFNYFLSVIFDESELMIMPYNRYIKDLNGFSAEEFLMKLAEKVDFELTGAEPVLDKKGSFGMYLDNEWYLLQAREDDFVGDSVKTLDVSILQDNILENILGIKDPRTDKRIEFIGGIRGSKELMNLVDEKGGVAFLMYPTSMTELLNVADEGKLMPPKSTWFEPKLRSGIFIHEL